MMFDKINKKNQLIIICGPTASGKTDLAVSLAKKLNTEVISADSMYIYKGLDIGTAKPSAEEMQGVTHHMIDIVSPTDNFTVSDYRALAKPIIDKLLSENKTPIICGGTGFYINSILYDLSYGNSMGNIETRNKYKELATKYGNMYVYDILKEKDPLSAEKLHFNDSKRVIRALEIYDSGVKKSDIKDDLTPNYSYKAYSINYDRSTLYERINTRVDNMINNGLIDEIKGLLSHGITSQNQCMQAIGYKEILEYLNGEISIDNAKEKIKLNTRHYAKRQITFFKKLNVVNLEPCSSCILANKILEGNKLC